MARVIRDAEPSLVATQEGTLPMLRDLDHRLAGFQRIGGAREHWPGEEPNAIYYDPTRLRVLDAGIVWLSRRPLKVGSRSWGDWARRSALWALLVTVETGAPLLVVNTHFDHVSGLARRRSARLLNLIAPGALLMGDFNTRPGSVVHRVLLHGRRDPLLGGRSTHNVFTGRDWGRMDWILVPDDVAVREAAIIDARRADGGPVSDHLPVHVAVEPPAARRPIPVPESTWRGDTVVTTKLPPPKPLVPAYARAVAEGVWTPEALEA